jgi:hypothetical protein
MIVEGQMFESCTAFSFQIVYVLDVPSSIGWAALQRACGDAACESMGALHGMSSSAS